MLIRAAHRNSELVGLYYIIDSDIFLYPHSTKLKLENFRSFAITSYGSEMIGLYIVMKHGVLLYPKNLEQKELDEIMMIKKEGVEIFEIPSLKNALGNNIHIGEKRIIVNPNLEKKIVKFLEDVFGKEVLPISIGGFNTIGSLIFENSKAFVIGYKVGESGLKIAEQVLGKRGYLGSLNAGFNFVKYCAVGNDELVIIGKDTTGIEEMKLIDYLEY